MAFISFYIIYLFVCCFESHEKFFSYLATVTITGDRADICMNKISISCVKSVSGHSKFDTNELLTILMDMEDKGEVFPLDTMSKSVSKSPAPVQGLATGISSQKSIQRGNKSFKN
jgi:hypothetical protein